uniref:AP-2 complex subunit alpha, putative n=1 Tax=Arundo donax TaxID=35708 RepID=A0A0A9IG11_ARUDO
MLPTIVSAKHWKVSFRPIMSFRTVFITILRKSLFSFSKQDVTMYPTCFSGYFGADIKETVSICPKSTSYPSI